MTAAAAVASWKTSVQRAKGRFGGGHQSATLAHPADEAKEQVSAALVERDIAQLVQDHDVAAGQLLYLRARLELLRFCGHLILWEKEGYDAEESSTVSTGVSPTDGRTVSRGSHTGKAGPGV
jgi:hypothetical protein